jgi:dipeptidyl-peptidase-4
VSRRLLAAVALLVLGPRLAAAEGEPTAAAPAPAVSLERVVADGYLAPLLEGVRFRPGRREVSFVRREGTIALLDVDTGRERSLVEARALDALLTPPERDRAVRGIGRASAPRLQWDEAGATSLVAHRGDLFHVRASGGAPERLTRSTSPISDPRFAPDGRKASFARDFDLWAVVAGEEWKTLRLTHDGSDEVRNGGLDWVYPEELGCDTGTWWSPDSSRLAFLRLEQAGVRRVAIPDVLRASDGRGGRQPYPLPGEKNPRARVGVVGLDGAPPEWMDLGEGAEYVPWAAWVPDGSRLLVAVMDRPQRRLTVRSLDPSTGRGETVVVEEEPDPGWIEPPEPLSFVPGRPAFVWRRPRDGHWRAVLVTLSGAGPATSTALPSDPGASLEVDRVVGVDAESAWCEGNDGDPTERALFRVPLGGGAPVRVTTVRGWHRTEVDPRAGLFLDTWSSAARPARQAVFALADGTALRPLADARTEGLDGLRIPPAELGTLDLPGAGTVRTRLRKPMPFDPSRRYPAIVFVYGGPTARSVRDSWDGLFDVVLAQEGFAVLSVDNRGSSGCGRAFETAVCKRLGRLEVEDQVAAAEHLKRQPWVDGARLGIWGWSYGGTMTCLAMTRAPGVFRAGVAVAPVTDWRLYDSIYTERYLGTPAENPKGYAEGSPLAHAARLEGALLLCHGTADDNVHFRNTALFVDALLERRKAFDLMTYPGRGHGLEGNPTRLDLYGRIRDHFRRHLGSPEGR